MHRIRERSVSAAATAIVIASLGYLLIAGLNIRPVRIDDRALTLIALAPPQPRPDPPKREVPRPKPGVRSSAASPVNLRSTATAIVAPPTILPPHPVVAAPVAGAGVQSSTGAADRAGPGEGAGGQGDGHGSGGIGDGEGDGGGDIPPRQTGGRIKFSDMPLRLREIGAAGTVSVRYGVTVNGRATDCAIVGSSGNRELDALTCQLIEARFRFRPSRDGDGRPVHSTIEEDHVWIAEPDRDDRRDDR